MAVRGAGEIPIPGTPVPITLQTFVVMLAGLMLPWRQAAPPSPPIWRPVRSACRCSPAAPPRWLWSARAPASSSASCPGVVAIALLRGKSDTSSFAATARTAGRYLLAALVGGVVVVYAFGFVIQSALTGAPLAAVALAPVASWLATPSRPWWPLWPPPACPSSVADLSY